MTNTNLIKMENGKKELPIGIVKASGRNKGYRLNRTVNQKEYNFGSIQNLEHALRTNGYIDIIVADLRDAQSKEGVVSIDEIRELIVEDGQHVMLEINQRFDILHHRSRLREETLECEIKDLHNKLDALLDGNKSFWGLFKGRKNK